MSAHVVVIATDLRRTTIKVSPGTYLSDVLQQACKKLSLSSDKYLLRNKQKTVDLSVPFRTSGLIPGAKLELVQKANTPSVVQVALQVPLPEGKEIPGGRLIQKFPSDLTLWKVMRQLESGPASAGRNINITARGVARTADASGSGGGQMYYETPVLNLMGREVASFPDFQKTLSQFGYNSGSVLIRLSFRRTDQTLFDAMEEISRFFQEEEQQPSTPRQVEQQSPAATVDSVRPSSEATVPPPQPQEPAPSQDAVTAESSIAADPDAMDTEPSSSSSSDPYRPVKVFLAPTGTVPAASVMPRHDSDYTPTVAHAQLHQARLQGDSRNRRLPSDRELEEKAAAHEAKLAAVQSVLVKVRFPDNTSSDWQIGPSESGAFLYEAVRHVMAHRDQPFKLVLPGSDRIIIRDDATPKHNLVRGYKLAGKVLINLTWDDQVPADIRKQPFLKSEIAQQGMEVKVQDVPDAAKEEAAAPPVPIAREEERSSKGGEGGGKKMPKWLKLGKK